MSTRPNHAVQVLLTERENISASIEKMQADLKDAKVALRSIDDAIAHLTGAPATTARSEGPTLKELILEQLSVDRDLTPLEIASALSASGRETSNTSVSSILSRLKADGLAEKAGDGWKKIENAKGSDAQTSEPFEEMGPVRRERGYPPSAPEGSIPSGSTASSHLGDGRKSADLDEEIPF
ncbi:hypothetical protein [Mesorhizobium sp.]|uniref:hypothetical protein n=1 Tax=Mesorhizobium sp. TaxID=1871066 RepID=UPI000FE7BB0B|nr:hypothetical protein [Mesorhizobium sp.]RWP58003.1 MAG: hypothetical protein EOR08_28790 [Mesorhizobium sp.]